MKAFKIISLILTIYFSINYCQAQISEGGLPKSLAYKLPDDFAVLNLKPPNVDSLIKVDESNDSKGFGYRFGITIPVNYSINNSGTWYDLPENNGRIWRLKIKCKDALAMGVYYNDFFIPPDCKLFVYNENKTQILGAYTYANNHESRLFANELVYDESIILEYYQPYDNTVVPNINISGIGYAYRGVSNNSNKGFGSSGSCEVNVNCSEGSYYVDKKSGVARISVKIGSDLAWCTGSLINNTNNDCTPYFLTADHCTYSSGNYATAQDFNQWIFYFNYQSATCSNPSAQPTANSITGCSLVSFGLMNGGSDFELLRLNTAIPPSYNLYLLGWDRSGSISSYGRCIHHPAGDIKKISYYGTPLQTDTWSIPDFTCATNAHWRVQWAQTTNGWGVTEGGSSGSPIFDNYGRIIGTLTGGSATCSNPSGYSLYGKFSYHWQSNNTSAYQRLQPWLDPANTSTADYGISMAAHIPAASYTNTPTIIYQNQSVQFNDNSTNYPTSWYWLFGDGGSSTAQNPSHVYLNSGSYTVSLKATTGCGNDTFTKIIHVNSDAGIDSEILDKLVSIYPNPVLNSFEIKYPSGFKQGAYFQIIDNIGKIVRQDILFGTVMEIDISSLSKGIYSVKIFSESNVCLKKLCKL